MFICESESCTKLESIINLCLPRRLSSAIIQNAIQKTPSGVLQREPGQRQLSGKPRKIHQTRSTLYLSVFQYPSSSIHCTSAVVYWRTTKDKEMKMIWAYVCAHTGPKTLYNLNNTWMTIWLTCCPEAQYSEFAWGMLNLVDI